MKIGEVSRRTGCNIETIRYYERIGIVDPPPRKGAYRDYGPADMKRLGFVRRARALGFSLQEVKALLDLAPHSGRNCEDVRAIAAEHLSEVRAKLADLEKMVVALNTLVSRCGNTSDDRCPLVESLLGSA